ncbi:MAG TPA: HAMP domain-containing sensor histidine kinase [Verrucomicrobiae bacterium]|nr:HAMP domain-containing sensor histidine kinase [Verrucomicrobiae bacterium]
MNLTQWKAVAWLRGLLATQQPEPEHQAERIAAMQLHIVLPAKAGVILVAIYYLFFFGWFRDTPAPHTVAMQFLKGYFVVYLLCNVLVGALFWKRAAPATFRWLVFTLGILDGVFVSGLVFLTGGFDSTAFWLFPGLIVLNAFSIPMMMPQLGLNLLLSLFYFISGAVEVTTPPPTLMDVPSGVVRPVHRGTNESEVTMRTNLPSRDWMRNIPYQEEEPENPDAEPLFLKLTVLWLLAACCYGVQVLAERQRRVAEEARESAVRQAQLHSAGRLAAEFAHQIKNPLAIINNAAYSMRKALNAGRYDVLRQIEIIQEEVERSDQIVTQIMGYAQLTEGRVEKLDVAQELDAAIEQIFPPGEETGIHVERMYVRNFPPLLMQRRHLRDALSNLIQNAREAVPEKGEVTVSAVVRADHSVEISVRDNGGGVAPDKVERIFEAYYSTKAKGSGLGLAIVKHNVELYAGTVRLETELGKGARFILTFPAKTVIGAVRER